MRSVCNYRIILIMLTGLVLASKAEAQARWGSYARSFDTKGYEGKRFKLEADVKAEVTDDSASARLWARVDKKQGTGFFNNMWKMPVRSKEWKTYSMEGRIDSAATRLYFGTIAEMNGKFYFDNFKISVETTPGSWQTVYSDGFDKDLAGWADGIGMDKAGVNKLYKTSLQADAAKGKVLMIAGTEIPNYGQNKKAGKFADVNGIRLYYEIYGQGPPLVVLHGNGGSVASASGYGLRCHPCWRPFQPPSRPQNLFRGSLERGPRQFQTARP